MYGEYRCGHGLFQGAIWHLPVHMEENRKIDNTQS